MFMCPSAYIRQDPWTAEVLALAGEWMDGNLPYPGGTQDQPYILGEAVRVIREEVWLIRDEERKEAERKRGK